MIFQDDRLARQLSRGWHTEVNHRGGKRVMTIVKQTPPILYTHTHTEYSVYKCNHHNQGVCVCVGGSLFINWHPNRRANMDSCKSVSDKKGSSRLVQENGSRASETYTRPRLIHFRRRSLSLSPAVRPSVKNRATNNMQRLPNNRLQGHICE